MIKMTLAHKSIVALNVLSATSTILLSVVLLMGSDTAYENDAIICTALILLSGVFPALSALYFYRLEDSKAFSYFPMLFATVWTSSYVFATSTYLAYALLGEVNISSSEAGLAMLLPLLSFSILIHSVLVGVLLKLLYSMTDKCFKWATREKDNS